jgi:hypothetical protein
MAEISMDDVNQYVNENIQSFHEKRLAIIKKLTLEKLINKNPYLFRAKNIQLSQDLIQSTMEAFLSSSEEKVFGDFLEDLAIYISGITSNGIKSASQGIDLEFIREEKHYLVSIKSGTNWGNADQHHKLVQNFNDSSRRIRQAAHGNNPQPVLGICYGKAKTVLVSDGYLKVVGQNFWALISGNTELYREIIDPIGYKAKEHNDAYNQEKAKVTNILTNQFSQRFCLNGTIDWQALIKANSENYDLDKVNY